MSLARVQRGQTAFAVRSQLIAAGIVQERVLRATEGAAEHCVEAEGPELAELKALGAVAARTARTTLVDVCWLARAFEGPTTLLLHARMLFTGIKPLPANLPAEEESDADDDEFEEHTEPEPGAPQMPLPAARKVVL